MDLSPVAFAYGAGLLAAFNPCGFVLLPTYAAAFLSDDPEGGIRAALGVSTRLTAGFLSVFTLVGLVVGLLGASTKVLGDAASWLGVATGLALLIAGVLMLGGSKLPGVNVRIGSTRNSYSYGVGYAFASLACALPVFLGAVIHSFDRGGVIEGLLSGVAYAVGMGTVVSGVVFLTAGTRRGAVKRLRAVGRWFNHLAGALLIVAGTTLVMRRWVEIRVLEDLSAETVRMLDGVRWVPAFVLVAGGALLLVRRHLKRRSPQPGGGPETGQHSGTGRVIEKTKQAAVQAAENEEKQEGETSEEIPY